MPQEIERKFLLKNNTWRQNATGTLYKQGYLPTTGHVIVRVRIAGKTGFITIKGQAVGTARWEFEYEIPLADAEHMLVELCVRPIIEKTRYVVRENGLVWEIDEFFGENTGLILAEVELESEDQPVDLPCWVGEEVTFDARYYNANLVSNPYANWK